MVRNRKRNERKIGKTDEQTMKEAVKNVVVDGMSIRTAAKAFDIKNSTLRRYVDKFKKTAADEMVYAPNYSCRQVFSADEELVLKDYLVKAAEIQYGLTCKQVRELAYQLAVRNKKKFPPSWDENKSAGEDWFFCYMKRFPDLSLRRPEATSLSRATSFNKTNVGMFYNNLGNILKKNNFTPNDIHNADETGCSTVQRVTGNKVVALKKMKQVGKITSGERGTLVTALCTINAAGNSIPPFMIFPRVHFKERMLNGAPPGTAGAAHQSGWMTAENFVLYMRHFIRFSKCSKERPTLLILDNHDTHLSLDCIDLAKDHGVVMLTLPPHCSHKLQPLDRTVYGPLKTAFNRAADAFMVNHPAQPITIYDISDLLGSAYPLAFTPNNIVSGFKCTGIHPYNPNVFTDEDFLCSYVTDRDNEGGGEGEDVPVPRPPSASACVPMPSVPENRQVASTSSVSEEQPVATTLSVPEQPLASTSSNNDDGVGHLSLSIPVRPEDISPFPKAGPRKRKGARKKGKSLILTDTPVKEQLREAEEARKQKKGKANKKAGRKPKRLKLNFEDGKKNMGGSDSENEEEEWVASDHDDASDYDEREEQQMEDLELPGAGDLNPDDFVLVKFNTGKTQVLYAGQIQRIYAGEDEDEVDSSFDVKFLRRKTPKTFTFVFPAVDDISDVLYEDIIGKLPKPLVHGGTARVARHLIFPVNLDCYSDAMR